MHPHILGLNQPTLISKTEIVWQSTFHTISSCFAVNRALLCNKWISQINTYLHLGAILSQPIVKVLYILHFLTFTPLA